MNKLLGNFKGCALGAFVNGFENIKSFQNMTGKKLAVVHWYLYWGDPFPKEQADLVINNGSLPLITWEPWIRGALSEIASGKYEQYIKEFLKTAKYFNKPILLRFAHEMNGNWYPWDGFHSGANEAAGQNYKQAWQYIHNVKQALKADNVKLVWAPNNVNIPNTKWNEIFQYFPGDNYVDWMGMDGYNWGYEKWQSFKSVFGELYSQLLALSQKPIMICEFASAEQGGNKAGWINETLSEIKENFDRIKIACWFNINKERDWRIDSSPAAGRAYREKISDGYFIDDLL